MGQIDSFKKVLGLTDQPTQIPEQEPVVKEEKPKAVRASRQKQGKQKRAVTLAVGEDTRSELRNYMYWARSEGLIRQATSDEVIRFMLEMALEKYPKARKAVKKQ